MEMCTSKQFVLVFHQTIYKMKFKEKDTKHTLLDNATKNQGQGKHQLHRDFATYKILILK